MGFITRVFYNSKAFDEKLEQKCIRFEPAPNRRKGDMYNFDTHLIATLPCRRSISSTSVLFHSHIFEYVVWKIYSPAVIFGKT